MESKRGRTPGRQLNPLELEHLQLLMYGRERAQFNARFFEERVEDFVLRMRESGSSARSIAEQVGVGSSTIQKWTANARARRNQQPPKRPEVR